MVNNSLLAGKRFPKIVFRALLFGLTKSLFYGRVKIAMRRIGLILAVFTLFLSCIIQSAYPFWIWTPESSRWVNPKASVKPNPKEQLKFIQELYRQAKYKETIE